MNGPRPPSDNHHSPRSSAPNTRSVPNEESNRVHMASPHFPGSHGVPPQVPPETYNYLIHALLSLQSSTSHSFLQSHAGIYPYPTQLGSLPPYNWPTTPNTPSDTTIPPPSGAVLQNMASASQLTSSSLAATQTIPTTQDHEQVDEATSIAEDKRRRNTAASARFRIKKKKKTLNLERIVADLMGRTEELEREATDLHRENAWLKEIVLLKGKSLASFNPGTRSGATAPHGGEDVSGDKPVESESDSTEKYEVKDTEQEH